MLKERILFTGVGQCGSQVTNELEKLDYNCFYINSSNRDFPENIDDDRKFLIDGADGCAGDRDKAIEFASSSFNNIINRIKTRFPLVTIITFVFGAGGGTGSGISPILLDLMTTKMPNIKFNAVIILPNSNEKMLRQNNAKQVLKEIDSIKNNPKKNNLCSIHLLDNNSRKNKLDINSEFAILFDSIADYHEKSTRGNLDGEELEKLITAHGFTVILEFDGDNENFKSDIQQAKESSIYANWKPNCNYLGAILNESLDEFTASSEIEQVFGVPIIGYTTFTQQSTKIIATEIKLYNDETETITDSNIFKKLNINIKNEIDKKNEIESKNEVAGSTDVEDIDVFSIMKNKGSKKVHEIKNNKNNDEEDIMDILNKYRKK